VVVCAKKREGNTIYIVANIFSKFFNVQKTFTSNKFRSSHTKQNDHSFQLESCYIEPITEGDVLEELCSFRNKKATGFDGISCEFSLKFMDLLLTPLTYLVNQSLQSGTFPDRLKLSIIRPLHKRNSRSDVTNYRPVCNLSVFSKLFEKFFILKVNNFLKKHNVIIAEQHGFTENRSTTTALFSFLNGVYEKLDQQERVSGVFYDLSKAFDLVDHDTLLGKIEKWGLRGLANSWIKSYLTNRKEKVEIHHALSNGIKSVSSRTVISTRGVVQGSVLGPFLFTLFINDMVMMME
jgi:hypothetical protein